MVPKARVHRELMVLHLAAVADTDTQACIAKKQGSQLKAPNLFVSPNAYVIMGNKHSEAHSC